MFLNRTTRKALGEALGISGPAVGKKLRGENGWSVTDLYGVAEYFQIPVADLLPKKVDAMQETPDSLSQTEGSGLVAGAGFEPTTSGL
ncbi:helix-turn-helix domain-containing protein [Corynebacterium vitaeruminis]|uniref:helix-turn-helix domain-containing protein n=1 Tax=Corynebacterium vitaeruminis TaxID=38305 RepID=UPI0022AF196D|nr:helix-turn-helix domain-containing protein [Corynebacterium vitaeruminis]